MITTAILAVFISGNGGASVSIELEDLSQCQSSVEVLVMSDPYPSLSRGSCIDLSSGKSHIFVIVPRTLGDGGSKFCWREVVSMDYKDVDRERVRQINRTSVCDMN